MAQAALADRSELDALWAAWDLQQNLWQLLKLALPDTADPAAEPPRFRALLARAGRCADFETLSTTLDARRAAARRAFRTVVAGLG